MLETFVAITLLFHFAPQGVGLLAPGGASSVIATFDELNGVRVGAPVVSHGQLVGTVESIDRGFSETRREKTAPTAASGTSTGRHAYYVSLKISPLHRRLLKKGTVALISSPVTPNRAGPETVIELLLPPDAEKQPSLRDGDGISGYSSYEAFWSKGIT